MRRAGGWLAAALVMGLGGCGGGGGAVDEWKGLVEAYCDCTDEPCRDQVRARVAAFDKSRLEPDKYTDMIAAARRADHCADRALPAHTTLHEPE